MNIVCEGFLINGSYICSMTLHVHVHVVVTWQIVLQYKGMRVKEDGGGVIQVMLSQSNDGCLINSSMTIKLFSRKDIRHKDS